MAIHPGSRLFTVLLALGWIGFLVYLAQLSQPPYVPQLPQRTISPLAHTSSFFVLASILYLATTARTLNLVGQIRGAAVVVVISVALALSLEALQYLLPTRVPQSKDVLFDTFGAMAGT